MTAWFVISTILGIIWILAFLIGNGAFIYNEINYSDTKKEDYQLFAAIMAVSLLFVFFHWILLIALVPTFAIYGVIVGIKILAKKPWRAEA